MDLTGISQNMQTDYREPKSELGKDDYLKLLITQMQYQDPLAPMDNQQMIAQLAQFTSMEQMTNVADSNKGVQAYAMIGKEIYAETVTMEDNSEVSATTQGIVKSIKHQSGKYYAILDSGAMVNVDDVNEVHDPINTASTASQAALAIAMEGTQAFSLLGKHAYFAAKDTDGVVKDFDGEVVSVRKVDGKYFAEVNVGKVDDDGNPLNAMVGVFDITMVKNS